MAHDLDYTCRQYGSHVLQRVGVWQHKAPAPQHAPWIVFIHGGAWRDPRNTLDDFAPSIAHLLGAPIRAPIRAFASIDYRLSPSDAYPQHPADTPEPERRTARHPDHVADVAAALRLLAAEHRLADDGYVLVGHSAGATLALQLLMGGHDGGPPVPLPAAIVAISGIYDLVGINARRAGSYAAFISAAFGPEGDGDGWRAASPACFSGSFRDRWPGNNRLALLAHSPDDSLVDAAETDAMAAKLAADGVDVSVVKDLTGEHNFVWQDGEQVARLVGQVLARLRQGKAGD
ncbi:alpha/beta hydrolase fold domain-containing protein [Hirsutella rhossiliensis]|uniref:Kynurenine formamidase n=1 Tax=Hirsutella rhossiliensis TaxID=111463 RepID=A0A9P8N2Y0_9HYPO|nr:alpha/beta hydrolase fold domain-containing protein [Hirsutella rhossiliensis]KAH0964991.1 alpha/beta hydrolase fold domain-containing protein [Hirsutella rhossiliensis]